MNFTRSIALLFVTLGFTGNVVAEEKLRLIETKPGVRFWSTAAERAAILEKSHRDGRCGGFMDLTNVKLSRAALPPTRLRLFGTEPKEQARVNAILAHADEGNLLAVVTKLSSFPDRLYDSKNGVLAAEWIRSRYETIGNGRTDVKATFFAHPDFKQPSVIAEITGSGPQKDEVVVIGGHLDSISSFLSRKAPGADDNASGTATVLEAFRLLVESDFRPNRTILFMGYAGEEEGLLGSGEIATWFRNKGKKVVGVLQFDMTMYPGREPRVTFITDYTNRDLTKYTERLADEYVKLPWREDVCNYGCSDHASWTNAGYPSVFPFEAKFSDHNQDIHTPGDTVANLRAGHGLHYLRLAVAFAVELAEVNATAFRLRR